VALAKTWYMTVSFNLHHTERQLLTAYTLICQSVFVADKLAVGFLVTSASNSGVYRLDYVDTCQGTRSVTNILFYTISRPNLFPNITSEIDRSIYPVSGQSKRTLQLVTNIHLRHLKM